MRRGGLKPALDQLYAELQLRRLGGRSDSDCPALRARRRPRDRRLLRRRARVRPGHQRPPVDRARARGDRCRRRRRTCGASIARRDGPAFDGIVHRWTRERRHRRAAVAAAADDRSLRVDRGVLPRGRRPRRRTMSSAALDSFSSRALALDLRAAYGRVPKRAGRLLLLPAAVRGSGLQAAEPVPALDGPARRARSGRLAARRRRRG